MKVLNLLLCGALTVALAACSQTTSPQSTASDTRPLLRVGSHLTSPPMTFHHNGVPAGVEIDFAHEVGRRLNMRVEIVETPFTSLIDDLLAGKIDVIMSNMSVTRARATRVDFSEPYYKTGQIALIRRVDTQKYRNHMIIAMSDADVAVVSGTTGDMLVAEKFSRADVKKYREPQSAVEDLLAESVDIFIHDYGVISWYASVHEAHGLASVPMSYTIENLAWASRRGEGLSTKLTELLKAMKDDGSYDRILLSWLPR